MSTPDFRTDEPVWVKYATYLGGGSDKFYELRIDLGDDGTFYVTKRWGRNPDSGGGQTKVEPYQTLGSAQAVALNMMRVKVGKGYREVERPWGADRLVVHERGEDYYAEDSEAF